MKNETKKLITRITVGCCTLTVIQGLLSLIGIDLSVSNIDFLPLLAINIMLLFPIRWSLKKAGVGAFQ